MPAIQLRFADETHFKNSNKYKKARSQKPIFGSSSLGFPCGEIWAGDIELSGDFASHGEGPRAIGQSWAYEGFGGLARVREGSESASPAERRRMPS